MFWLMLLFLTEMILFSIAYISRKGDIVSPSIVTLVFFLIATACCLYNINDWKAIHFTHKAYFFFSSSFLIMLATEKFAVKHRFIVFRKYAQKTTEEKYKSLLYIPEPASTLLFIAFMFCAVYYIYRVYQTGKQLGAISFLSVIGFNKEEGDFDIVARLMFNALRIPSYVYVVMTCHNIICCKDAIKNNLKGILIVGSTILCIFFSGQRSVMICYIIGIVVAASISLRDSGRMLRKIETRRFIRKLTIISIVTLGIFFLSANIVKGTTVQRRLIDYMTYYFGSPLAIMGNIVIDSSICHYPFVGYFGEKTFMGFWQTMYSLGIVAMPPADRKWVNLGSHLAGRAGNEYTFLCGPYIDFGFIGALVFVFIFYLFFANIYYGKIINTKTMTIKRVQIIAVYIFLYNMVAMTFYQDTIRSYSRPITIMYVVMIAIFARIFLRFKRGEII